MRLVGGLLKAIGDSVLLTRALGHELCNALLFPGVQNGIHRRKAALELFQLDLSILFSQVIAGPATPYAEPFASGWVPARFFMRIAHQLASVMKLMLSGPSERGPQQEPLGFFCPMWAACIAHSLVVMLAVVLIKRELHNLDVRLALRNESRKEMEPLAGFRSASQPVP